MITILELIEKTLTVILSVASCMGLFLIGVFTLGLFQPVDTEEMWYIFLGAAVLTLVFTKLWEVVRYYRLSILAEDLMEQDTESQKLYEHLTEGLA